MANAEEGEKEEKEQIAKTEEGKKEKKGEKDFYELALDEANKHGIKDLDNKDEGDGIIEGDDIIKKLADSTYDKRIDAAIKYVTDRAAEYLSKTGLETYSPKYLHLLENIQDPDHIGLHLIYSQFLTLEGIGMFTHVLDYNGFTKFKIKKGATGEYEIDISEENMGKPTYALYTGLESREERETLRRIYNSSWNELPTSLANQLKERYNNNNNGEVIKVFMITASGSEGINLRNTRYVHIMEPYWHPARMEQVIGRARRICSHTDLPDELQTVDVFVYLMTLTQAQIKSDASIELKRKDLSKQEYQLSPDKPKAKIPFTSDEALFEISNIKDNLNMKLLTAIKEASIDCATYSKLGMKEQLQCLQFGNPAETAFAYKPSITQDEPDTVSNINKEKVIKTFEEVTLGTGDKKKKYMYSKIDEKTGQLYDYDSYLRAKENPKIQPTLLGTLITRKDGSRVFQKI